MDGGTPLDKLFSLLAMIVISVAILSALSHKQTGSLIKTIGTQWNNSLKAMESA
jgi:hypothetical protein